MKISTRIILACLFMATLGILASGGMVAWQSLSLSEQAMNKRTENQLVSIREIKREQVKDYFNTINQQILTFADESLVTTSIASFTKAYDSYIEQTRADTPRTLTSYYQEQFARTFTQFNAGGKAHEVDKYQQLSPAAKALQSAYISNNPNKLGEKNKLNKGLGTADYHNVHNSYHHHFDLFLQSFGYYDIFLVDLDGNVIYSVFKELDYATNLISGPYANSGLGDVFQQAMQLEKGQTSLTDFSAYYPSYNNAASFIATPIAHHGDIQGILIFQMPINKINSLMTYDHRWQEMGLGESGETYLVGTDKLLRSQSRFLIEDKNSYIKLLEKTDMAKHTIAHINATSSAIGLHKIDSRGVNKALDGQSGFEIFEDYRGVKVLSAFAPIELLGLRWAILSELDESESLIDSQNMKHSLLLTMAGIFLVLFLVAGIIGMFISRSVAGPITAVIDQIETATNNKDLTLRLAEDGNSELARLGHSLNIFFNELQNLIANFNQSADKLSLHSEAIVSEMEQAKASTSQQSHNAESVSAAITQMSTSVQGVAEQAKDAANSVQIANEKCLKTSTVARNLGTDITQLNERMIEVSNSINQLEQESISIGSVLDVIQGIAEQTNLLALNAAIEAARAGEQGRGFAVVADEVRTLASRTQSSTEEIRAKIEDLQSGTKNAVEQVSNASGMASKGIDACDLNGQMLDEVVVMIESLNDMNLHISTAANQQSTVTEEINSNGVDIANSSIEILQKTENTQNLSQELLSQANELKQQLSVFKY